MTSTTSTTSKTMSTLMRFHLASFSVMPKTLSVLVWTLPFSYHFHKDDTYSMRFHFAPLLRASSENAQRLSMHRRPKRIEMYAVSNELVWTGPKTSSYIDYVLNNNNNNDNNNENKRQYSRWVL